MQTSQFEGKKVALKQTKDGHVLTLAIHPDEIPEEILRDFVGARYMVVMVRIGENEEPMERQPVNKHISIAGMLCRDPQFWEFLFEQGLLLETSERDATEWLKSYLNIDSRSELKDNEEAQILLNKINREFKEWKS
jgi:hypothetical protein